MQVICFALFVIELHVSQLVCRLHNTARIRVPIEMIGAGGKTPIGESLTIALGFTNSKICILAREIGMGSIG